MLYVFVALCLCGSVLGLNDCPNFRHMKDFDVEKFEGVWMVHRTNNTNASLVPLCSIMKFSLYDGQLMQTVYEIPKKGAEMDVRMADDLTGSKEATKRLMKYDDTEYVLQIWYTDYDKYAVISTCKVVNGKPEIEVNILTKQSRGKLSIIDIGLQAAKRNRYDETGWTVTRPKLCLLGYHLHETNLD